MSRDNIMQKMKAEETNGNENTHIDNMRNQQPKRKRNDRHNPNQVEELELFFKECPHPTYKRIQELSSELGMEVQQVKFWFQNKRTQMKKTHARQEHKLLRIENEKLRAENVRYREALSNASCVTCGCSITLGDVSFEEQKLRVENTRLREEITQVLKIGMNYVGKHL